MSRAPFAQRCARFVPALLSVAVLLLLPRVAFSTCAVTLTLTQSNNMVSYTATSSGSCGGSRIDVYRDGNLYDSVSCQDRFASVSCTSAWTFPTYCMANGTHTLVAIGQCNIFPPSCAAPQDSGTATATFTTNSTPSVSLDIPAPDPTGHTVARVTYAFQNTNTQDGFDYERHLRLITDYSAPFEGTFSTETGVWEVPLTLTCMKGSHSFKAVALACAGWPGFLVDPSDPAFIRESQTVTKIVTTKPIVGVAYADSAALDGTGTATVSYSFPNTASYPQRRVRLDLDGHTLGEWIFDPQSGTMDVPINLTCAAPGVHTLVATAFACGTISPVTYPSDPDLIAQASTSVNTDHKPVVGVSVDTSVTPQVAIVDYSFPRTNDSSQRLLQLVWAATGELIAETHPATMTGVWRVTLPACAIGSDHDLLLVHAVACGDESAESSTAVLLPQCDPTCSCPLPGLACAVQGPTCVGSPIRIANGNMRMIDRDPLPSASFAPLSRTYDSQLPTIGAFGRGWASLFDAKLRSWGDTDGREIVSIRLESDDRAIFARQAGLYMQIYPTGAPTSGTLRYDAASATFVHRDAGSTMARIFRASDGRLVALRSLAEQYEVRITYTNNKPARVEDSRGDWGWTIAADANGAVGTISVDGRSDLVWTYVYDGSGNLTTVRIGGVIWRNYTYGLTGMTEARDGQDRLIESHTYDASGNALSSSASADDVTNIAYNAGGARVPGETVTRVTYATGRTTDYFSRFVGGKMRTVEVKGSCACGSDEAVYAYDGSGHVLRQQNASGYITMSVFGATTGNVISTSTNMRPSACDPATAADRCRLDPTSLASATLIETQATLTTTMAYGDARWPDKATATTTTSVVAGHQRTESRIYHPLTGGVVSATVSGWRPGTQPAVVERSTTTLLYGDTPPAGDPLAPAFDPGGSFSSAWLSLPQPAGLTRFVDGPRSDVVDVVSFVYYPIDASVPATLRGRLAATRNALGRITRIESYDVFGNVTRMVDANGVASESTSDALGRSQTTTLKAVPGCDTSADALCATDLTTTRTYVPAGPLESEQKPGGGVTAYTYDGRGRVLTVSRGASTATLNERIETTYDEATGHKSLERYLGDENGAWIEKHRESFAYDAFGRVLTVTHADNTMVGYAYDEQGRLRSTRDENHATPNTFYAYDPAGRLATVTQSLSTAPGGTVVTSYAYDRQGNLVSVTDPNGNATAYVFDDLGQMVQQSSPVSGVTTYAYDAAGNLVATTDANGATTTRTYDAADRILTAVSTCTGSDTEQVTWTYDDSSPAKFGIGRLASMTDPSGSTAYAYERRGLLRNEDRMIGSWSSATPYAHDANGNRTRLGTLYYTYDAADRASSVTRRDCPTCQALPIVTSASYLPFGPEAQIAFGNGTQQTKSYDSRYRITENKLTGSGAVTVADYTYVLDAAGNIMSIHDITNSAFDRSFGYDDLNRLTAANTGTGLWGTASYAYDRMGNMLSAAVGDYNAAFTFVGATPRLASATQGNTSSAVDSDAVGNEDDGFYLAGGDSEASVGGLSPTWSRQYSCRNLLKAVVGPPGPASGVQCPPNCNPPAPPHYAYAYDGRGVRVHVDGAAAGDYVYTPELQLRLMHDVADTKEFAWFNGHAVAQISQQSLATRFTFTDHLGTPLLQTNSAAQVAWRAEYEPYGRLYELRAGGSEAEQPLRLPGQEIAAHNAVGPDEHYNIFRWYRSGWGRYTQADPLAVDAFTPERERMRVARAVYEYAFDNPLRYVDPLGLQSCPGNKCGVDCPGGDWVGIGANSSAGLLFGKSSSLSVLFCTSSGAYCHFSSRCTTVGLQAGASAGVSLYGYTGCKCIADIIATNSLSFGPVSLNAGGNCVGLAYGVGRSVGAQTVVGSVCTTKLLGCVK